MAKIIKKRDLIDEKALAEINADGEKLLLTMQEIGNTIKSNLQVSKEYFQGFKAMDSASLKQFNQEIAKTNRLIEAKRKLDVEEVALQKQVEKSRLDEIKLQRQREKAFDDYEKKLAKANKEKQKSLIEEKKLNSVYEQSKKRLNDLSKALIELEMRGRTNSKVFKGMQQEFEQLNNSVRKAEANVGRFQRNVGNYPDFKNIAGNIGMIAGVGVGFSALSGFVNKSVDDFREFDGALKEVSAITGITGDQLEKVGLKAREVGANGRAGATEYLEAIKLIGSASPELLKDQKALENFADAAITLKQAAGIDLATAAGGLTAAKNQFNLTGKDFNRIINTLAAGSKEGSAEVAELTESFKNVGTVASEANLSLEQTVAALEVLAEKQLKGAEAGTKLRGAIAQLQKAGLGFGSGKFKLNDALKDAEKLLNGIKDPAAKAQKAIKLFGVENQVAGQILIEGQDRFKQLTAAVTGTNTAYEQAAINQQSAAAQSEKLNNQLQAVRISIGEKLTPVFNVFKTVLLGVLQVISWAITQIGKLFSAIDNIFGISAALRDLAEAQELVAIASEKAAIEVGRLGEQFLHGKANIIEYMATIKQLGQNEKDLDKFTSQSRRQIEKLNEQLRDGTITALEYYEASRQIRFADAFRVDTTKKLTEAMTGSIDVLNTETEAQKQKAEATKKAIDDAYNNELKALELRKTNAEIFATTTIKDEKERTDEITNINLEYLGERAVIEKKYNKDYRNTIKDRVNAELDFEKKKNDEIKAEIQRVREVQKEVDKQKNNAVNDPRTKEENAALIEYLDNLDKVTGNTKTDYELRAQYYEDYKRKLKSIDDKYAQEQSDLEDEQYFNEQEIYKKTEELKEEKRKKELQERIDFGQKVLDMVEKEVQRENELDEKRIEDEISRRETNIDKQRELAEKGLQNQVAFEEKKLTEAQIAMRKEKENQVKQEKLLAFFKSYAAYADKDPSTALNKAARDAVAAGLIAAAFYEGTEDTGDGGNVDNKKGFYAVLHPHERVIPEKMNDIIGGMSNEKLTAIIDGYNRGFLAPRDIEQPLQSLQAAKTNNELMKGFKALENELKQVKEAIIEKPVSYTNIDNLGNVIKTKIQNGLKTTTVVPYDKPLRLG